MSESALANKIANLFEQLKQPSTIKALGTIAATVGYTIDQTKALELLMALQVFFGLINLFYDQNPRKSVSAEPKAGLPVATQALDVATIEAGLSNEQIVEIVRARKAKIAAEKATSK
jgi:hypothetical protein